MFACQRIQNLFLAWECRVNSRHIVNAVKGADKESTKTRNKTRKKKPDFSKLYKNERIFLREKLLKSDKGTSKTHVYKNIYPWENSKSLAEHLKNTEVYNIGGLIALNKPYGIAQEVVSTAASKQNTLVMTLNSGNIPAHIPAMNQVLPHLKNLYGVNHLEVIKSTERWSSGLMLLSTSSKLTEKIQKCLRRSKAECQPAMAYRAVTVGLPVPVSITTKVGTQLEYIHNVGHVPVIVKEFSKRSVESRKVKPARVEHSTLVYNKELDASLIEVKTQVSKWHFLRVWLAFSYSPALGDHLYSGRVKKLLKRRVQVSPHNVSNDSQMLPDNFYSLLALPLKSSELIPCHIHLSEITLKEFHKDKSDLVLSATPPEHFTWTCKKLGLLFDKEEESTVNESMKEVQ